MDYDGASHNPGAPASLDTISQQLHKHEAASQARYEAVCEKLEHSEAKMGMEGVSDKVNINLGDGGMGGGAAIPALIAAMNSGNGGNDGLAAIIAAQRGNDGGMSAALPALLASNNNGMNNIWPIVLLALLGRGRGGFLGGDGDCGAPGGVSPAQAAFDQSILNGITGLTAAVPTAALETQNAVLGAIANQSLAQAQAFANTGDKITNTGTVNLIATKDSQAAVLAAITALGDKIDNNTIMDLQRQLGVAQALAAEERSARRSDGVRVDVTQQVNQQQAQAQFQVALNDVVARMRCLEGGHNQLATAINRTIQFGTGNVAANTNTANNAQ